MAIRRVTPFTDHQDRLGDDCLISIVIPCLNEERTIVLVIEEIMQVMDDSRYLHRYEVVVSDNSSVDRSALLARSLGARVVVAERKGYGAALSSGIAAARGEVVVMLDADHTYDAQYIPDMVSKLLRSESAMVVGSRLKGIIDPGAMPWLHRYLGTPVLTSLINRLWSARMSDCNSGMRAFRKSRFQDWQVGSPGMEFASEMIVSCLIAGDRIEEVPIRLRKDLRDRASHLRRWNDGMRHLLFILSRAPHLFQSLGVFLLLVASLVAVVSMFGPFAVGGINLFGYHSLILSILFGFIGTQAIAQGLILDITNKHPSRLSSTLLNIPEGTLFWILVAIALYAVTLLGLLFYWWSETGFQYLAHLNISLFVLFLVAPVGSLAIGILHAHTMKRAIG